MSTTNALLPAVLFAALAATVFLWEAPRKMSRPPTQEPITGREELGDLSKPTQALAQFYRALNARDMDLMSKNWDQGDEAVMDHPVGGIKRGWPEIRKVYERVFQGRAQFSFEFYDYTLHEAGELFYAVGRERGQYEVGGARLDLTIRTTRVFRKIDGRWRQVHHHGSIDDGKLLEGYQTAVTPTRQLAAKPASVQRTPLAIYSAETPKSVARVEVNRLTLPPAGETGRHRHPGPVVSYVLAGRIVVQVEGEPAKTYTVGQSIFEPGAKTIVRFDNASKTEPATFVATYLLGADDKELIKLLK